MTFVASAALWMAAAAATGADLPRAPCDAQDEVRAAVTESPATREARLAELDRLVGFELLRGVKPDDSARVDIALERLKSLCASHRARASAASAAAPSFDANRLEEILSRREFDGVRDRKGDALAALFHRAVEWFFSLIQTKEMTTGTIAARYVILVLAAMLAIFGILRLRNARRGLGSRPRGDAAAAGPLLLEDPAAHLGRAQQALSSDPREAIREGLLALLSVLERQRWARPDRVKTNRELARELPTRGAPSEIAAQVESLVHWYDRTFYSLAPVAADEARRFVDEVTAFQLRVVGGAR